MLIKIYGGCFGCQVIAHALGGIVDYNPDKRFVLKLENISFLQTSYQEEGEKQDQKQMSQCDDLLQLSGRELKVIVSHGDCVLSLPRGAALLASSATCAHEVS
jgi:GMP synthase (glutamine-hydrolysing)